MTQFLSKSDKLLDFGTETLPMANGTWSRWADFISNESRQVGTTWIEKVSNTIPGSTVFAG